MNFESLSKKSSAGHVKYAEGVVSCDYHDKETDNQYRIRFRCPPLRSCFASNIGDWIHNSANPCYEKISDYLDLDENGRFVFSKTKKTQHALLSGAYVALGLKGADFSHFASIRTSPINSSPTACLLAVVITDLVDIVVEEK